LSASQWAGNLHHLETSRCCKIDLAECIYKHQKICESEENLLRNRIKELEESLKKLQNETTKPNINIHIDKFVQNNTINVFGKESMTHINEDMLDRCIGEGNNAHSRLVKYLFSSEKNRNIQPCTLHDGYYSTFNGKHFVATSKQDVISNAIEKSNTLLDSHYDESIESLQQKFSKELLEEVKTLFDKVKCNDDETMSHLKKNITKVVQGFLKRWEREGGAVEGVSVD
jgi:hypothetical protein